MVPAAIRRGSASDGLQPLRMARDWRQVIDLIYLAFGETLDAEARHALRNMRPPQLVAPVIALLDSLALPGEGMMPGFVWREGGQVIGTASVRRVNSYNTGWLISNVAVHPDWQGRGIGRALVEAAVDFAKEYGATWIVLQVRDDNTIAQELYASLDFQPIGEVVRLCRPAAGGDTGATPSQGLRPARWSDGRTLSRMAQNLTPHDVLWADSLNHALYKTGPLHDLSDRLKGRRRQWWMLDEAEGRRRTGSKSKAAVGVEVDARTSWHRLRLLIPPTTEAEGLAAELIAFGLARLADAALLPVEIEYPAADAATQSALAEAGFERVYALKHMRLNL